jgi:hypothetical protein
VPHVVIEGNNKLDFQSIHDNNCFDKTTIRNNSNIIKFEGSYLNRSKDTILINTTVVQDTVPQKYYIQLLKKENQVTIRLDPVSAPKDKTKDVKRSIALVAKKVLNIEKNSKPIISKTNLKEFLCDKHA